MFTREVIILTMTCTSFSYDFLNFGRLVDILESVNQLERFVVKGEDSLLRLLLEVESYYDITSLIYSILLYVNKRTY